MVEITPQPKEASQTLSEGERLLAALIEANAKRLSEQQPQQPRVRPVAKGQARPKVPISWPFLLMVAGIVWVGFMGGSKVLSGLLTPNTTVVVYQTATAGPGGSQFTRSTPPPAGPPPAEPSLPVPGDIGLPPASNTADQEVPAQAPAGTEATPIPQSVINQVVDIPVPAAAPAPKACTLQNATYTVYRTITSGGQPVGKVTAFSCATLAEAEAQADIQEATIREKLLTAAGTVLDAPPPTPHMGEMGGGGGDW